MQPLGVHHVSINVGDVATAVEFYTTVKTAYIAA